MRVKDDQELLASEHTTTAI